MALPPPKCGEMGHFTGFLGRWNYPQWRGTRPIKGHWYYLYRTVDKHGQTIDFLLTKQCDERAAKRFLSKAIRRHGVPETMTIDGSAANKAAIESYNAEHGTTIAIRQTKHLNNIVEQDHRAAKPV